MGLHSQHPKRMHPVVLPEAGNTPELSQWLQSPCGYSSAHVGSLPTELFQQSRNHRFGSGVVAAVEHGGRSSGQDWVDHECAAYTVECLHECGPGVRRLESFHERLVWTGEIAEHSILRLLISDGFVVSI